MECSSWVVLWWGNAAKSIHALQPFHLSWSAWIWLGYVRAVKNCGFGFKILFATCPYVLPLRVHKYSLSSSCYTTLNKAKARFERHSRRGLITVIFEFFSFRPISTLRSVGNENISLLSQTGVSKSPLLTNTDFPCSSFSNSTSSWLSRYEASSKSSAMTANCRGVTPA